MRLISDVINNSKNDISKEELLNFFKIDEFNGDIRILKILYYFNISGFYIPYHLSSYDIDLSSKDDLITFAKKDKKITYHNNDNVKSQNGDIALSDDIYIIISNEAVKEFIRIPDHYLYTNIHINIKKKSHVNHNLTSDDKYMLDDAKSEIEISICDSHEDGA